MKAFCFNIQLKIKVLLSNLKENNREGLQIILFSIQMLFKFRLISLTMVEMALKLHLIKITKIMPPQFKTNQ